MTLLSGWKKVVPSLAILTLFHETGKTVFGYSDIVPIAMRIDSRVKHRSSTSIGIRTLIKKQFIERTPFEGHPVSFRLLNPDNLLNALSKNYVASYSEQLGWLV